MKKSTFQRGIVVLLFALLFIPTVNAQVCPGDIILSTQAEVDAFTCTEVTGGLTIEGADITDLSPLASLSAVGVYLVIQNNTALSNLDGLSSLSSIGIGNLVITNCPVLTNLDGLSSLSSLGGNIYIDNNAALAEFCGLFPLLDGGFSGIYSVTGNAANPTQQEIIDAEACITCPPDNIFYVDENAAGLNNGTNWDDAFNSLQDALTFTGSCASVTQIWVASGTYFPTSGTDQTVSFVMKNGVAIYGGFAGNEDPLTFDLADRDFVTNETILSGNIGDQGTNTDNIYTVVNATGTDNTSLLDGFTIAQGYSPFTSEDPASSGGGMFIGDNSSPVIANCSFVDNYAATGGAVFSYATSDPTATTPGFFNCTFTNNVGSNGGGGIYNKNCNPTISGCTFTGNYTQSFGNGGGAIFNFGSSPEIDNCEFTGNNSGFAQGGAISNFDGSNPTISNCLILDNSGLIYGGGIYNNGNSSTVVTNCTFSGNTSNNSGSGIAIDDNSLLTVTNCTFTNNTSNTGGGGIGIRSNSAATIINTILWGDTDPEITVDASSSVNVNVSYSIVKQASGLYPGTGNKNIDPQFVDPDGNDFRLISCSPAINSGDNTAVPAGITTDLDGNPRFYDNGIVDMGAYEYQGDFVPCCPEPTILMSTDKTSTTANLGWTENGTATSWEIRLGLTDFDTTGVSPVVTATNPYPATGLNPSTAYDYYIRSACDGSDFSEWVGPYTFTTNCAPPTAVCQNITVFLDGAGNASIVAADLDGGSSDNCGSVTLSATPLTFSCANVGSNNVSFTANDGNGNSSNCTAVVTVADTTSPTAVCQNITVFLDGAGNASIVAADLDGGSSDNCGPVTLSATPLAFTCANIGPNNISFTANDGNGNSSNCTAVVTVADTTSPTAVCQNITVFLDGAGNASIVAADLDGGSSDNCGSVTLSATPLTFTCANVGPNNVSFTASDGNGNSSNCIAVVTVADTTSPTAVCQNITVFLDGAGNASIVAADLDGGSSDNCGSVTLSATPLAFTCANLGPNNVSFTANDGNGNSSNCTAVVTVADTTSPTAVCQNITVFLDGAGNASIVAADLDGGSSDNCGSVTLSATPLAFSCANIGPNNVSFTANDGNGNSSNCTAVVTVADTTSPTAVCQNITVFLDGAGNASIVAADLDGGSSDNCGILNYQADITTFDCDDVDAPVLVTLTVTDYSDNMSSCTSTVTVLDTISPTAVCQNITVYLDATGNASITANDLDGGSTDNCGILNYNADITSFDCADVDAPVLVTLTISDYSDNMSNCTSLVTVLDTISPTAVCQNITVYLDATGNASIIASDIDGGSSDNCGIINYQADITSFDCADLDAPVLVTLTVTDYSDNMSSCTSAVTVLDTISYAVGSISGASTIDFGSSTGTLTLSGNVGAVQKWQKRLGTSGGWTDIANTTAIYSETPSSLGTWQYRTLVQSGACSDEFTEPHSVAVGAKELTLGGSFTANDKIYDDNTDATFLANNLELVGVVDMEDVSLSGLEINFEFKTVGTHLVTITNASLSGGDMGNYTLSLIGAPETTATINAGPALKFLVTNPEGDDISSPKLHNIPFDAKVTLVDAFDNPTPNTGGDVSLTLTGSGGETPGDLRFQGFPSDPVTQTLMAGDTVLSFDNVLYTGISAVSGFDVKIDASAAGSGSASGKTGESNLFSVRNIFFSVEADPTSIAADGVSKSDITVTLEDHDNNPITNQTITIETDKGTLMEGLVELSGLVSRSTDANGQVLLQLRADNLSAIATVTAKCPGACPQTVEVAFTLDAPVITGFTPGELAASLDFIPPTNVGLSTISNYEYSLDNGVSFTAFVPAQTTSPVTITGLTDLQIYPAQLRAVNEAGMGAASASMDIYSCANPTNGGEIASAQDIFEGDTPDLFTNVADATNYGGTLEYQWQSSISGSTSGFTDILDATDAAFQPDALNQITWFRRLARVSCKADWSEAAESNVIKITVFSPPTIAITTPLDGETLYDYPLTVSGTSSDVNGDLTEVYVRLNGGSWQLATGTENWSFDLVLTAGYQKIEAKAVDALGLESDLDEITVFVGIQEIELLQDWSLISSYLDPADPDLVNLWADVVSEDNLRLMIGMDGIYAPAPFNINTMINWDVLKGYKIKMNARDTLIIHGHALPDNEVDFAAGAHIIPVLTNQSSMLLDVFDNPQNDVRYILDLTSNQAYWPDGDIYTLNDLIPGRGYLANFKNPLTLTFPELSTSTKSASQLLLPTEGPWACKRTGSFHLISITAEAINEIENADYLGAFNSDGNCLGYAELSKSGGNILLTIYGNDETSPKKDGYTDNELLSFRSYSLAENSETELTATFNESFPNHDGLYATDGLSAIVSFKADATGIGETVLLSQIRVYPNPAKEELNLVFEKVDIGEDMRLELMNASGSIVLEMDILQKHSKLKLDNVQPGVYLLKVIQGREVSFKKVVVR